MKRKLILIFCILFLCITVSSAGIVDKLKLVIARKSVAANGCLGGTYLFYWDGDHALGNTYACINSGASTRNAASQVGGALHTDWGEGGSVGFKVTGKQQHITWDNSSEDILKRATGTIWYRISARDDGTDADAIVFESYYDGNNYIIISVLANERVKGTYTVAGDTAGVDDVSQSVTRDSWDCVGYAWDQSGSGDQAITVDCTGEITWETDADGLAGMANIPDTVVIGNNELNAVSATTEMFYYNKIWISQSYKAAYPW